MVSHTHYQKFLTAMNEPTLYNPSRTDGREAYRLLWLRTFDPPVALRLTVLADGSGELAVKQADGQGGYYPGQLVVDRAVRLGGTQVRSFVDALARSRFWSLATKEPTAALDGADWVLEGVKGRRYHIVDRKSPESGTLRDAMTLLLSLSGLDLGRVY